MTPAELANIYRNYIACLNRRDWAALGQFVHDDVAHNARPLGLAVYRAMLATTLPSAAPSNSEPG